MTDFLKLHFDLHKHLINNIGYDRDQFFNLSVLCELIIEHNADLPKQVYELFKLSDIQIIQEFLDNNRTNVK